MKVIALIVQSINGRITKGSDEKVYQWTSGEDKEHLKQMTSKASLIVMGSTTYEAFKKYIQLSPNTLRMVMTSQPEKYKDDIVIGQLEFVNKSPKELVEKYEKKGYKELLLLGGSKIYSSFLEAGLLNELLITIEPVLFGTGTPFIESHKHVSLKLVSIEKLNDKGTLLLKYSVYPS